MKHQYTQTSLETRFGDFFIRVYADAFGKETIVLRTENFDPSKPVLVRIHSECITGDTFGSLRCDCGEQLHRSIELIEESGNGVLIYLRQEGRGIGLFEKMRSYELQRKGFDTFEANVILGHRPDERNYEWAIVALNDLGVKQIKLITNNPSKVSEIAKLGILVVDRVPIVIKSNNGSSILHLEKTRYEFSHDQGGVSFNLKYDEFEGGKLNILEVDAATDEERDNFNLQEFPYSLNEVTGDVKYYGYRVAATLG